MAKIAIFLGVIPLLPGRSDIKGIATIMGNSVK
jgi:hypothetical protein